MRRPVLPTLLCAALAACGGDPGGGGGAEDRADAAVAGSGGPRRVILLIGDGMGPGQLEAARQFRGGPLFLDGLPVQGQLATASLSGTTDSAAAATAMATGVPTLNGFVGIGPDGAPRETLVERARALGLAAGVVTTSYVSHATPAAFTAHEGSRARVTAIAEDQALRVQPDVLLGGGGAHFLPAGAGSLRDDDGLIAPLLDAGYEVVTTADELAAATAPAGRLVGLFAPEHLAYVTERAADTTEPRLADMALAALALVDRDPDGFFLVIEGARIDMASHENQLARAVGETLDFDDTVAAVSAWAEARGDVTVVVTADHECGGLEVTSPSAAPGLLPGVAWRWGNHTNARVVLAAQGPGTEAAHGAVHDFVWLHELVLARLEDRALAPPPDPILPDGRTDDLRHRAALQTVASGFGEGYNQLDALWLDAGEAGLAIAVEGLFEVGKNNVVLLIDRDLGAGTGVADLRGALSDELGDADRVLAASPFTAPAIAGFGADLAIVSRGAGDPRVEELLPASGARGFAAPLGAPSDLAWLPVAINFGEGTRVRSARAPVAGEGLEVLIPWASLYPAGVVPVGATIGVAAVLVNDDGGFASNQALPPFAPGTADPGLAAVALPGVVRFELDPDRDGVVDGGRAPTVEVR